MNGKTGRLLIVTGLPGAGKTHRINNIIRQQITGLCIHDFHADAIGHSPEVKNSRHFIAAIEALMSGHDCVIADIEFCHTERRDAVAETFQSDIPGIEIEYHCLKNQLQRCISNIKKRSRHNMPEEIEKAEILSKVYEIPAGAIEHDVWQE